MVPISILDLSPIIAGATAADALHNTLDLAQHAEKWGFRRFWLAEHHNIPGIASAATSVVIGYVAGGTRTIRVGSGGIMLPNHSPLVIAEQFGTLASLYPGRIDLGLGRAPGTDSLTMRALRRDAATAADSFPRDVQELMYYFRPAEPGQKIRAVPGTGLDVPVWLLGSSDESALLAAQLGQAFCFAHFINEHGGAEVTRAYRARFCPSPDLPAPRSSVAIFAVCAETEDEARRLARSRDLFIVRLYTGRPAPYPSVEEAERYPYNAQELAIAQHAARRSVVGTPDQVRERLLAMAADYQADELVVVTITHDFKARLRSYELLAAAFELPGATAPEEMTP